MHHTMRPAFPGTMTRWQDSRLRRRVALKMDAAQFAIASVGVVLGLVEYRESDYKLHNVVVVDSVSDNGRYVRVTRLSTGIDGQPYVDTYNKAHWHNSTSFYRIADSLKEYGYIRTIAAMVESRESDMRIARNSAREDLNTLSQNTVTRALVHASEHGYCQETVVALISAGHKMPDVRLSLSVTLDVSVTVEGAHNYYALRALFGATEGNVQNARNLNVDDYGAVGELIHDAIQSGDFETESVRHMDTDVTWHAPSIRILQTHEASRLVNNEDNE